VDDEDFDCYMATVNEAGVAEVYSSLGTTRTQLAVNSADAPVDDTEHALKIVANGGNIDGFWKGTQIGDPTDPNTDITADGVCCIGSGLRVADRNDDCDYDNLTIDTLAAAVGPTLEHPIKVFRHGLSR